MNVILDIIVIDAMNFVAHRNGLAIVVLTAVATTSKAVMSLAIVMRTAVATI